jgi:hypothetical protein
MFKDVILRYSWFTNLYSFYNSTKKMLQINVAVKKFLTLNAIFFIRSFMILL